MASYGLCKTRRKKSTSVQQYTFLRHQALKTEAGSTIRKHFVTRQKIWCSIAKKVKYLKKRQQAANNSFPVWCSMSSWDILFARVSITDWVLSISQGKCGTGQLCSTLPTQSRTFSCTDARPVHYGAPAGRSSRSGKSTGSNGWILIEKSGIKWWNWVKTDW